MNESVAAPPTEAGAEWARIYATLTPAQQHGWDWWSAMVESWHREKPEFNPHAKRVRRKKVVDEPVA